MQFKLIWKRSIRYMAIVSWLIIGNNVFFLSCFVLNLKQWYYGRTIFRKKKIEHFNVGKLLCILLTSCTCVCVLHYIITSLVSILFILNEFGSVVERNHKYIKLKKSVFSRYKRKKKNFFWGNNNNINGNNDVDNNNVSIHKYNSVYKLTANEKCDMKYKQNKTNETATTTKKQSRQKKRNKHQCNLHFVATIDWLWTYSSI